VAALCLLGLMGLPARAAAQTVTDERVWLVLVLQERADKPSPWRWSAETILRTRNGVQDLDVAAFRPILTYAIDRHSSIGGGVAVAVYSPATPGIVEMRVFQQYIWSGPVSGGTLSARVRFEQRFIETNSAMAMRLRLQGRFSHPVRTGSKIALVGYDELFLHLNTTTAAHRGVEQNRAFAGISDTLTRSMRVEVGYVNQFGPGHGARDRMNHVLFGTLVLTF
jgi:hypothetical protein